MTRTGGFAVVVAASLATVAAMVAPVAAQASASRGQAPAVTYYKGTSGVTTLVPRGTRAATASGPARVAPRGSRRPPYGHFSATETVPDAPKTAASLAAPSSPQVNFNGVSSRDSQFTNYNQTFEPPDQGLCEGNGYILEVVNSVYRIYNTAGKSLRGPFNMNDLFDVGGQAFTTDPRCFYDPRSQTWFASVVFVNNAFTASSLLLASQHNRAPTGLWHEYVINTTHINGCKCLADQPRIGIDQDNLYITDDEYSLSGTTLFGGEVWAFNKAQMVHGAKTLRYAHFADLKVAGEIPLAPQPALSAGAPDAEYFLGALDANGKGDHRLAVWAMTKRTEVAAGGVPVLSSVVITSEAYADPPSAPQKGATSLIDSDDDRMLQAELVGGTIWGALTTAVKPSGDTSARAGGAWFQVKPRASASGITGASIVRQGYIDAKDQYVLYPAVQPDAAGNAAAVFTLTSANRFPSAAYATLKASASGFGPLAVAAAGTGHYDPKSTRWGDYSFAVPDGTTDSAWLATEYIPPKSSQTTTGASNWGTRVFEVPLG